MRSRLNQLDGLRGLAILMVIFTHLRLEPYFKAAPPILQPLLSILAHNGLVGVALLFMLSGYLMTSLYYTVPSLTLFWQKRYTRIFPAFIAMATALAVIRASWEVIPTWGVIAYVLFSIVVASSLWRLVRQHPHRKKIGQLLFKLFLFFQLCCVIGYLTLQAVVPPAVFLQLWPNWARQLVGWLVNSSMALPFGNYIGQLDGVYWSVCLEVLFYILYPVIFLPLLKLLEKIKSKLLQLIALFAVGSFFYGLHLASQSIYGLHLLQFRLGIFFVLGMVISRFELSKLGKKVSQQLSAAPNSLITVIATLFALCSPLVWQVVSIPNSLQLLTWSIPLAIMFFITLQNRNWWSKLLSSKVLTTLGMYSYSLYLTHTIAIELITKNSSPQTVADTTIVTVITGLVLAALAIALHHRLEKPYIIDRIKEEKNINDTLAKKISSPHLQVVLLIIVYFFTVWLANRVPISPLTMVTNHPQLTDQAVKVITTDPTKINFTATDNQLGMLLINIKPMSYSEAVQLSNVSQGGETQAMLQTRLLHQGSEVHRSDFALYQISESRFFTIGIPLQPDSKNKEYTLELRSSDPKASSYIGLLNEGVIVRTVYFLDKKLLLSEPSKILKLSWQKLIQPFSEQKAQQELFLGLPLLIILAYLVTTRVE